MALRRAGESSGAGVRQPSGRPSPTYPTNCPSRDTPPRPLPIQNSEELELIIIPLSQLALH